MTFTNTKQVPYKSAFDGSDTEDAIAKFLEEGGEVTKCPDHTTSTGYARYRDAAAAQRKKQSDG